MEMTSYPSRPPIEPPPYSPPEPSNAPAVIIIPPAINTHRDSLTIQNSSVPTQVTVPTSTFVIPKTMGPIATPSMCPSCNNVIVTKTKSSITLKQHLFALLLCGIGFWPCVFVPYVIASCKKVHHFCPICSTYIGTYV